jgi:uncharacterized damage-inducible protein DinB
MNEERQALRDCLDRQRAHVLGILEDLTDEHLRRPVLPSGWNCLGMVKHLALSDEHYWFRCIVGGESLDYFPKGERADWTVGPTESPADIFDLYRDEIQRANAIIDTTSLESEPRRRDEWWGDWKVPDVRFIMLHVIAETACHAGHLDAVREILDGRQWIVL